MFNPVPARTPEQESNQTQSDGNKGKSPPSKASVFLCLAIVLQSICFLSTFLPWTTLTGTNYAGYEAFFVDYNYDGSAGKVNLVASAILFVFGMSCALGRGQVPVFLLYRVSGICWNTGFSIWLLVIYLRMSYGIAYGWYVGWALSIGCAICLLGNIFAEASQTSTVEKNA